MFAGVHQRGCVPAPPRPAVLLPQDLLPRGPPLLLPARRLARLAPARPRVRRRAAPPPRHRPGQEDTKIFELWQKYLTENMCLVHARDAELPGVLRQAGAGGAVAAVAARGRRGRGGRARQHPDQHRDLQTPEGEGVRMGCNGSFLAAAAACELSLSTAASIFLHWTSFSLHQLIETNR